MRQNPRRMGLDEVTLVIDAQMLIRARRIKYFENPALKVLHAAQVGSFPYPNEDGLRRDRQMSETRETVEKLKLELQEVWAAAVAQSSGPRAPATENLVADALKAPLDVSSQVRGRAARMAASGDDSGQLAL